MNDIFKKLTLIPYAVMILSVAGCVYLLLKDLKTQEQIENVLTFIERLKDEKKGLQSNNEYYYETKATEEIQNSDELPPVGDQSNIRLAFRFKNTHCDPCVKKQIALIQEITEDDVLHDMVIVGAFPDAEEIESFKRKYELTLDVISVQKLELSSDNFDVPYYFLYTDEGQAKNIFYPVAELDQLSKNYFLFVKHQL